jgi:hypothetical protein
MDLAWKLFLALSLPLVAASGSETQQPLEGLLSGQWQYQFDTPDQDDSSCRISRLTAYEQVKGPVPFSVSAAEHPEVPKLSAINDTVWEQWEFDGVAASGGANILMGFSRDPSYGFFGQGNLRVEFYMTLDDGTRIQELEYTEQSTIKDCPDSVSGVWNSSDRFYAFWVAKDMQTAKVWWEARGEKGSLVLESLTPPHLADGQRWSPKMQDEDERPTGPPAVEMAPGLYFNQPIAGGRLTGHVQVGKRTMHITGYGGHCRLWAEDSWFKVCRGWHVVRGFLGPYTISYWQPISRVHDWVSYFSAILFKNGEVLVATQIGTVAREIDHVLFRPDYTSGNVSGSMADKSTGRILEFVAKATGKTWRFRHTHQSKMFEMALGGGTGLTGFVDDVVGGEVGTDEHFEGKGITEQVLLPDKIKQWQIWVVYGIGFLGRWKNRLAGIVPSLW